MEGGGVQEPSIPPPSLDQRMVWGIQHLCTFYVCLMMATKFTSKYSSYLSLS